MCWEKSKGVNMFFFFFFFVVVQFHMMTTTLQKVWTSFGPDFTFRGEKYKIPKTLKGQFTQK